jgi:hypothetical protein
MGGTLVQLLLLDHPHRLHSATMFATGVLGVGLAGLTGQVGNELPGPDPGLLVMWPHLADERDRDAEITWRIEHWRLLNGAVLPFETEEFRELEERVIAHSATSQNPVAHAQADRSGLDRGAELAHVQVPTLVIEAPEDPINPPPHAAHLAVALGGARLTTIAGMGHALSSAVIPPLAETILDFIGVDVSTSAPEGACTRRRWGGPSDTGSTRGEGKQSPFVGDATSTREIAERTLVSSVPPGGTAHWTLLEARVALLRRSMSILCLADAFG